MRRGFLILSIFTFILVSCVQQGTRKTRSKNSNDDELEGATPTPTPTYVQNDELYWYTNAIIEGPITINPTISDLAFLRGGDIQNFLITSFSDDEYNHEQVYCVVVKFDNVNSKGQLRVRGVPYLYGGSEWLLRVDFPSSDDNKIFCGGELESIDNQEILTVFSNAGKVYIGTSSGAYYSNDNGVTFSNYSTDTGLTSSKINSIYQDSSSVLYFATENGLSVSNNGGTSFSTYTLASGLPTNSINDVFAFNNNIYAATDNGLSILFNGDTTFTTRSTTNSLPTNKILTTFVDSSGTIYAGTDTGLAISTDLVGANFTTKNTTTGIGSNTINDIVVSGTNIYLATNGGVSISNDSGASFSNKTTVNGLGSNSINSIFLNGANLFAATTTGLSISSNSGASFSNKTALSNNLKTNTINDTFYDGNQLLAATSNGLSSSTITGDSFVNLQTSTIAYAVSELCTSCNQQFQSTSVELYYSNSQSISDSELISNSLLALDSTSINVDPFGTSSSPVGTCTSAECSGKGYSCCLSGQCVNDGQERPGASSNSQYDQAIADINQNSSNYSLWEEIFYVCHQGTFATPTPSPTPDVDETIDANLQQNIIEYNCLNKAKESPPDYSDCTPNSDYDSWDTIRRDVWTRCGCVIDMATPGPDDPSPYCPDFGLKTVKDTAGNIIEVKCDIPSSDENPSPFQDLDVEVSSRSAPHRFYAGTNGIDSDGNTITKGDFVDDISIFSTSNNPPEQEGERFYYLDEGKKTGPVISSYSMNSIIGELSLELNSALPAVVIELEPFEDYVISANQGSTYTPCYTCDKDSWFRTFTAYPGSSNGNGLQFRGYSTNRQIYSNNTTYGNYEDTIFGRACWIPPTMIPFSHKQESSVETQRENRLKTQAAYYVNGYQRDWFGFNKGALIGSFDGVRWFAVGNGRLVEATSTKLFLAMNSSFNDLATISNTTVSVIKDPGGNQVTRFDYDPSYGIEDSKQNQAGTCQKFHMCENDSDCISTLGWEYMCGDVTSYKTNLPKFDMYGKEVANFSETTTSLYDILQTPPQTDSNKRCVYRGAGAPCKQDYSEITNENERKLFTCAPNFYCANISSSNFNDRIVRTPKLLENYLFGQEADFLGRPESYVNASSGLDSAIISNIEDNASLIHTNKSDFGICRPGRRIYASSNFPNNQLAQHQEKDTLGRTDYISQIGSCDSTSSTSYNGNNRVISCPLIDEETGDLINRTTNFSINDFYNLHKQNSCGGEALYDTGGNLYESIFKNIEGERIPSSPDLSEKTLAGDSCLRRAGSVCNTNLDCSPNVLHSEIADRADYISFGGTKAELNYWKEYLVCGQASPQPSVTDSYYTTFDMTLNRCCREISSTLTMHTQTDNIALISDELTNSPNINLITNKLPKDDPKADGRYSRYTISSPLGVSVSATAPYTEVPKVEDGITPKQYQWKTFSDTGEKSCCGGGWIRQFSSGGHDWASAWDRFKPDVKNFKCLNYENSLAFLDNDDPSAHNLNTLNYDQDYTQLCRFPQYGSPEKNGGCIQVGIQQADSFEITPPQELSIPSNYSGTNLGTTKLDTSPTQSIQSYEGSTDASIPVMHSRSPYMPIPFYENYPSSGDTNGPFNYVASKTTIYGSSFYLPIYIGRNYNITRVALKYFDENDIVLGTIDVDRVNCDGNSNPYSSSGLWGCTDSNNCMFYSTSERWCTVNISNHGDIFHIRALPTRTFGTTDWSYAGVIIEYNMINSDSYNYNGANSTDVSRSGLTSGNDMYYLTKLAKFELNGIPQITYEPLYCNSDRSKLVANLYSAGESRTQFNQDSFLYDSTINKNSDGSNKSLTQIYDESQSLTDRSLGAHSGETGSEKLVYNDKLSAAPVFSSSEFTCCMKLNSVNDDASKCCSNYSLEVETTEGDKYNVCKLPATVDLNVYFNRFVSSEGTGDDVPESLRLSETDFIPETGEPKNNSTVDSKIQALGEAYCSSGEIRQGGAFGSFKATPNNSSYGVYTGVTRDEELKSFYSIADESQDFNEEDETGTYYFNKGFKWNHHWYCDYEED